MGRLTLLTEVVAVDLGGEVDPVVNLGSVHAAQINIIATPPNTAKGQCRREEWAEQRSLRLQSSVLLVTALETVPTDSLRFFIFSLAAARRPATHCVVPSSLHTSEETVERVSIP